MDALAGGLAGLGAGGDELTPTMKLKRKPIAEKYSAEIEAIYA